MAGTTNLAKVTRIAQLHGAHVRLIGDDRQLSAVEAGGVARYTAPSSSATRAAVSHS